MDLGESRWSAFRLVTVPLIAPGHRRLAASSASRFSRSTSSSIAFFLSGAEADAAGLHLGAPALSRAATRGHGSRYAFWCSLRSCFLAFFAEIMRRRGVARAGLKDKGGFL